MSIGKGTKDAKRLTEFVQEAERIDEEKRALSDELKALFAAAKAAGFDTKTIRRVLKLRKQDANERDEADALLAVYLHALGMAHETPLAKVAGLLSFDATAREELAIFARDLLPEGGEIIIKTGPVPVRIWKDAKGKCHAEDWRPPAPRPLPDDGAGGRGDEGGEVPIDVDAATEEEAQELGHRAARAGCAANDNPYDADDERRAAWERGFFAELKKPRGGRR